jgi:hypothetical protein
MEQRDLRLVGGYRVAVIGGGSRGSFFSFFLLDLANRVDLAIRVDIYEPRDFTRPGPVGCNMCGGIISESLAQSLATEGILLPPTAVQRGIDSFTLHMDVGSLIIETPAQEKRMAAIIPKGDYVSVFLRGEEVDNELVQEFLDAPDVKACFPAEWDPETRSVYCSPRLSIAGASHPNGDRFLFVGDCGVTRLYKDGIGAAYRTAKAAAKTAVLQGISTANFAEHCRAVCQGIETDNLIEEFVFFVTRQIQKWRFTRRAVLRMTTDKQSQDPEKCRMSLVLMGYFYGERTIQRDPYAHPGADFFDARVRRYDQIIDDAPLDSSRLNELLKAVFHFS